MCVRERKREKEREREGRKEREPEREGDNCEYYDDVTNLIYMMNNTMYVR